MSQCSNCNQTLTCGCQRRNASNGVQVCSNCLSSYESQIKNVNQPSAVIEEKSIIQPHRRGQALRKFIK
jgi:transcription elongation factor Elf1